MNNPAAPKGVPFSTSNGVFKWTKIFITTQGPGHAERRISLLAENKTHLDVIKN